MDAPGLLLVFMTWKTLELGAYPIPLAAYIMFHIQLARQTWKHTTIPSDGSAAYKEFIFQLWNLTNIATHETTGLASDQVESCINSRKVEYFESVNDSWKIHALKILMEGIERLWYPCYRERRTARLEFSWILDSSCQFFTHRDPHQHLDRFLWLGFFIKRRFSLSTRQC